MAFHIGWGREKRAAAKQVEQYFQMMTGYQPQFTSLAGGIFEMDLTRACVATNAKHRAKLKPVVVGKARADLKQIIEMQPNKIQSTYDFLYRLSTIYDVENNAFVLPIVDQDGDIIELFPQRMSSSEIKTYGGQLYLVGSACGRNVVIEYEKVAHLRNHYYSSDFYGESNRPLDGTIRLIDAQRQVIENNAASSGVFRFMARLVANAKDQTIKLAREKFASANIVENNTGLVLFDSMFADVKQIDSRPTLINPQQMDEVRKNAFEYFGTNEKILTSSFTEDEWNAYYEGTVEPWALQVSQALTNMIYSSREKAVGNLIMLESNRLEYASNQTKLAVITQMFDRGFLTHNGGREIMHQAPVEGGDKYYIRREYAEVNRLTDGVVDVPLQADLQGTEKPDEPTETQEVEDAET